MVRSIWLTSFHQGLSLAKDTIFIAVSMVLAAFDIMPPLSSGETDMKLAQGMIKYVYSHSSYWVVVD